MHHGEGNTCMGSSFGEETLGVDGNRFVQCIESETLIPKEASDFL